MCGIGGWIAYGDKRPHQAMLEVLMKELEERGKSASGVAWVNKWGDNTCIIKGPVPGSALVRSKIVQTHLPQISKATICIVHTRMPTKGAVSSNKNNHPVFRTGGKYAVVHNGSISNDDAIFETIEGDESRQGEVDTEALVYLLNKGETPEGSRKKLEMALGSYAIAALPMKAVDHVLLLRYTSPIAIMLDDKNELFLFASTESALKAATLQMHPSSLGERLGFEGVSSSPPTAGFRDDHYIILGSEGIVASGTHKPDFSLAPKQTTRKTLFVPPISQGWGGYQQHPHHQHQHHQQHHQHTDTNVNRTDVSPTSAVEVAKGTKVIARSVGDLLPPPENRVLPEMLTIPARITMGIRFTTQRIRCGACWSWIAMNELRARQNRCPECMVKLNDEPQTTIPPTHDNTEAIIVATGP